VEFDESAMSPIVGVAAAPALAAIRHDALINARGWLSIDKPSCVGLQRRRMAAEIARAVDSLAGRRQTPADRRCTRTALRRMRISAPTGGGNRSYGKS
jgi:hypothetical protein